VQGSEKAKLSLDHRERRRRECVLFCCVKPCCFPFLWSANDFIWKRYFDNSVFEPLDLCICQLEKGIATEHDVNYCCYCINCVCIYDVCTKPCFGGEVRTVLVPNDHACFPCATRCLPVLCTHKIFGYVKDAKQAKEQLLSAMRQAEAMKKEMKGVKTKGVELNTVEAEVMART